MRTPDHHAEIARRFLSAWNAGGSAVVDELAAPDLEVSYPHFPEPIRGAGAFKDALARTHEFFPDLAITADEVIATGDTAVVRWSYRATHQRGELFGIQPAGRSVEVHGITIFRIQSGRVQREEGVVDNLGLMMQLKGEPHAS